MSSFTRFILLDVHVHFLLCLRTMINNTCTLYSMYSMYSMYCMYCMYCMWQSVCTVQYIHVHVCVHVMYMYM